MQENEKRAGFARLAPTAAPTGESAAEYRARNKKTAPCQAVTTEYKAFCLVLPGGNSGRAESLSNDAEQQHGKRLCY
jgi:hypothetical protein